VEARLCHEQHRGRAAVAHQPRAPPRQPLRRHAGTRLVQFRAAAAAGCRLATPFARENQLHAAYLLDHIKRSLCETNETTAEWAYWGTEGEGLLRDLTEKALKHQASLGHQWPIGAKRSWPKGARANKGDLPKLLCQVKEVARVQLAVQLAVSVGSNMPRPIRTVDWRKGGCFGEAAVELAYEFAGEGKGHNVWPGAASATHSKQWLSVGLRHGSRFVALATGYYCTALASGSGEALPRTMCTLTFLKVDQRERGQGLGAVVLNMLAYEAYHHLNKECFAMQLIQDGSCRRELSTVKLLLNCGWEARSPDGNSVDAAGLEAQLKAGAEGPTLDTVFERNYESIDVLARELVAAVSRRTQLHQQRQEPFIVLSGAEGEEGRLRAAAEGTSLPTVPDAMPLPPGLPLIPPPPVTTGAPASSSFHGDRVSEIFEIKGCAVMCDFYQEDSRTWFACVLQPTAVESTNLVFDLVCASTKHYTSTECVELRPGNGVMADLPDVRKPSASLWTEELVKTVLLKYPSSRVMEAWWPEHISREGLLVDSSTAAASMAASLGGGGQEEQEVAEKADEQQEQEVAEEAEEQQEQQEQGVAEEAGGALEDSEEAEEAEAAGGQEDTGVP